MTMPELKRTPDLGPDDFRREPLWMRCHGSDRDQPWYDLVDEITYRPWPYGLPYPYRNREVPQALARCEFILADGARFEGYCLVPLPDEPGTHRISFTQPGMFLPSGQTVSFWWARLPTEQQLEEFYSQLARTAKQVFPIRYQLAPPVLDECVANVIPGFGCVADRWEDDEFVT